MRASHCLIEPKPEPKAHAPAPLPNGFVARIEPGLGVLLPHASNERLADLRRLAMRYNALTAGRPAGCIAGAMRLVR